MCAMQYAILYIVNEFCADTTIITYREYLKILEKKENMGIILKLEYPITVRAIKNRNTFGRVLIPLRTTKYYSADHKYSWEDPKNYLRYSSID